MKNLWSKQNWVAKLEEVTKIRKYFQRPNFFFFYQLHCSCLSFIGSLPYNCYRAIAKFRTIAKFFLPLRKILQPLRKLLGFALWLLHLPYFKNLTQTAKINTKNIKKKCRKIKNRLKTKINLKLKII